jgi:hypothetical protein
MTYLTLIGIKWRLLDLVRTVLQIHSNSRQQPQQEVACTMHPIIQATSMRALHHVARAAAASHDEHYHHGHGHSHAHDHEHEHEHEHDHGSEAAAGGMSSLNLRLLAMAVILVGGLAGVLPPIMGKWMASPDSITGRAVRAFSGGAILGVALVGAEQQTSNNNPVTKFS